MKFRNYQIIRSDELNWTLIKTVQDTAKRDIRKKDGKLICAKGDPYESEKTVGYYSSVFLAINGIINDLAGVDCDDLNALRAQFEQAMTELRELVEKRDK